MPSPTWAGGEGIIKRSTVSKTVRFFGSPCLLNAVYLPSVSINPDESQEKTTGKDSQRSEEAQTDVEAE